MLRGTRYSTAQRPVAGLKRPEDISVENRELIASYL